MPSPSSITIAFSDHRPETLALTAAHMGQHDVILLEEAETPGFEAMLQSQLAVEDYVMGADFEFPEFARQSCGLFRRLHAAGKRLHQVDPYLTLLSQIHDLFGSGGKPADIDPHTAMGRVYAAERSWTAAILDYYERCLIAPFAEVIDLVQRFAREDAARGRLRDDMRAEEIVRRLDPDHTLYVEAGSLHVYLLNALRDRLPPGHRLRPLQVMAPVARPLCGRRQSLGPGDKLTLRYTYRPDYVDHRADLLAARSLVHVKILDKEEIPMTAGTYPHTEQDVRTNAMVERLEYMDCQHLYGEIKKRPSAEARAMVQEYIVRHTH